MVFYCSLRIKQSAHNPYTLLLTTQSRVRSKRLDDGHLEQIGWRSSYQQNLFSDLTLCEPSSSSSTLLLIDCRDWWQIATSRSLLLLQRQGKTCDIWLPQQAPKQFLSHIWVVFFHKRVNGRCRPWSIQVISTQSSRQCRRMGLIWRQRLTVMLVDRETYVNSRMYIMRLGPVQ